jgi:L-ascorbate metabolism protein UlaG (beta-lactamase superfamily)
MRSRLRRAFKWVGLLLLVVLAVALAQAWKSLGHRATGERRARMERSPQWRDGAFENPEPIVNFVGPMIQGMFNIDDHASPEEPVDVQQVDPAQLATPPSTGLRITWLGHSTSLIELDGARVLTDPVWSERISPLSWIGPTRWYRPLIALEKLGPLDAVIISHDHYDHLDMDTVLALKDLTPRFIVPLGVGAHLEYWGIPLEKIVEVDWGDRVTVGPITIHSTPVRHASGRHVLDKDATLWSGYALLGPTHRVFFSGDTGLFTALQDIGDTLGPFDATLLEVGQYHRAWPDWHMGPEQAVTAHQMLKGKVFVPLHWGLLTLAYHGWTEPIERSLVASQQQAVHIVHPKPGQSFEPEAPPQFARWWPALPYETAAQHPVISGNVVFRASAATTAAPAK